MKIPKSLKIGGHLFKVLVTKGKSGVLKDCIGFTSRFDNTITIDGNLCQSQIEETLFHEVFHVMNGTFDDTTVGHLWLDSLSEQIYQVLSDNKLLSK